MRWWSITHWLIAVNIAVFAVDYLSDGALARYGELSGQAAVKQLQLWRWITYAFLHADPGHILFNMLGLWAFGPIVESNLGRQRYLMFYLAGVLGGVAGYLLLWRLRFLEVDADTTLIGASAGVFSLLVAAARLTPDRIIQLIWPPIRFRFETMAWIYIGIAVVTIAVHGANSGGEASHLGGALAGYVLMRNPRWLPRLRRSSRSQKFWRPGDPASNFFRKDV